MLSKLNENAFGSSTFADQWAQAFAASYFQATGGSYSWCQNWWQHFQQTKNSAKALYLLKDDKDPNVIFPLMVKSFKGMKIIEFLGQSGGAFTDYVGPLCPEKDFKKQFRQLLNFLYTHPDDWDFTCLRLALTPQQYSEMITAIVDESRAQQIRWDMQIPFENVRVDFPLNFATYLASLGYKTRRNIKFCLRNCAAENVEFNILTGDAAVNNLKYLFELNSKNWTVFNNPQNRLFLTSTAKDLVQEKEQFILPQLTANGDVIATVFGFLTADTCYLHAAGVNRHFSKKVSPGITMYAHIIQSLIEKNIRVLDLGPGLQEYKLRLGGTIAPVYKLNLWHNNSPRIRKKLTELCLSFYKKIVTDRARISAKENI